MSYDFKKLRDKLKCNTPIRSPKPGKKRVVKACEDGKEKIIHFGHSGYSSNYSDEARKSFRARHNCDEPKSKLSASYWACKNLWSASSPTVKAKKGVKRG